MDLLPIVFIILALVVACAVYLWKLKQEEERTRALAAFALERGFTFYPTGEDAFTAGLKNTFFMGIGHSRRLKNLMVGQLDGREIAVFDLRYLVGSGKNQREVNTTIVCAWFNGKPLPQFALRPEHFGHRLGDLFGFQDFDFENRPLFSQQYVLQGPDEAQVRAEFHPNLFQFFESHNGVYCEGQGDRFLFYRLEVRSEPAMLLGTIHEALDALQRFRPISEGNVVSAATPAEIHTVETSVGEVSATKVQTQQLYGGGR